MMPFFSAAFATTQPVDARVRWASVTAVALGALSVAAGYVAANLCAGGGRRQRLRGRHRPDGLRHDRARAAAAGSRGWRGDARLRVARCCMVGAGALLATLFLAGVHAGRCRPGAACGRPTPGSTSSASSRSSSPRRCCTSSRPSSGRASCASRSAYLTVAGARLRHRSAWRSASRSAPTGSCAPAP